MWKPFYGECTGCQRNRLIVVKKGYCKLCNQRSKGKPIASGLQRTAIKKKAKKATGEAGVFLIIWAERKHVCQLCGVRLGEDPKPIYFSHCLSKGSYVRYRLNKMNILISCEQCHHEYEFGDKNQEKFKLANMIAQKLKRMYYGNDNANDIDPGIDDQGSEGFPS